MIKALLVGGPRGGQMVDVLAADWELRTYRVDAVCRPWSVDCRPSPLAATCDTYLLLAVDIPNGTRIYVHEFATGAEIAAAVRQHV
ncbi:hypothetical protein [Vibrio phage VP16T]|nr:hypothetical protein [Vibrio phage VP16T]